MLVSMCIEIYKWKYILKFIYIYTQLYEKEKFVTQSKLVCYCFQNMTLFALFVIKYNNNKEMRILIGNFVL